MKALGKVIGLLIVVGIVFLGAWKALDSTLFDEDQLPPSPAPVTNTIANPPSTPAPTTMSAAEAFSSASDDSSADESHLTCEAAGAVIGTLYDLRIADKRLEDAITTIQSDSMISEGDMLVFESFAKSLWSSPKNQLQSRDKITADFGENCLKIEAAKSN